MESNSTAAWEHVEEIGRRTNLSIGVESNPFRGHLHQPDENLSADLHAKGVHVVNELIQNAEDNEYQEGVDPSLEFVITSKDITNTGAPVTLLVFNNDKGFSNRSIDLLCTESGYLGEKGNGFKSVFLITPKPYIFGNDYQIMFNEKPCQHCNVSYIVPEWVENGPTLSDIKSIYGSAAPLPTTTLVLPIKPDKVKLVKDQLSSIHPEFLLFHEKLKRLSVREDNEVPGLITVSPISVHREKVLAPSKRIDAGSYTVHLTTDNVDRECAYYMWEQRFQVMPENRVDDRMEVVVLTLAFPHEQRSKRDASLPGVYSSFLPTDIVTNFPFIIQADFLLDSSKKSIIWDNKWNQGILDCVPDTFLNAFTALVTSIPHAPVSSIRNMFRFLPVNKSSHLKLNDVRDAIKAKLKNKKIVPYESYTKEERFCTPNEVRRMEPSFRSILNWGRSKGMSFPDISFDGGYVLTPLFDIEEYNAILEFLEVRGLDCEWYAKCIKSCNLVMGVSEVVYIQLLVFIADSWGSWPDKTSIKNTPLIKYVRQDGMDDAVTLVSGSNKLLVVDFDSDIDCISWLINWNQEFPCSDGRAFLPKVTQKAIRSYSKKSILVKWLKEVVGVKFVSVFKYAEFLSLSVELYPELVVTYARFLYDSLKYDYLSKYKVENLCSKMPILDNYGGVNVRTDGALVSSRFWDYVSSFGDEVQNSSSNMQFLDKHKQVATNGFLQYMRRDMHIVVGSDVTAKGEILVPANGSAWVELFGMEPWRQGNYVEMGEAYNHQLSSYGGAILGEELVTFLRTYAGASDVPNLSPTDVALSILSGPLTKRKAFLLLDWIRNLKTSGVILPERFLSSIKYNSWLKVFWNSNPDYCPPSESFMLVSSIGNLLRDGSLLFTIPLLDEKFYGEKIKRYKEELQTIGVRTQDTEACEYIGKRLMFLAASSKLTKDHVLSILKFIEFLGKNYILSGKFINIVKKEKWVMTSRGNMAPGDSIFFNQEWDVVSQISDPPFIDQDYYGEEVLSFKKQLAQLGVVVNFNESYQLVVDNLKTSSSLTRLSSEAMLLLLRCLKGLESSDKLVQVIKNTKCLKTNLGYRCPSESFLANPGHASGSRMAVIDEQFYGSSIFSMKKELKKIGVMMELPNLTRLELPNLSQFYLLDYLLPNLPQLPQLKLESFLQLDSSHLTELELDNISPQVLQNLCLLEFPNLVHLKLTRCPELRQVSTLTSRFQILSMAA